MFKNLICFMALAAASEAAPIAVANASFETFNPLTIACAGVDCAFNIAAIPGWQNGGESGSFRPGNPSNTNYFDFIPDGVLTAYTNGSPISQIVGSVAADTTYTLLVDVGDRYGVPANSSVSLLVGSDFYTASPVAIPDGGWSTFSVQYVSSASDVGKALLIVLGSGGVQGNFDKVRLDAIATPGGPGGPGGEVPEPGSAALAVTGLGLAWFVRRRRRA